MEWHIRGWVFQRKVDITFKKSYLRTLTKPATDTKENMEIMVEKDIGVVVEPWLWGCDFGRDKSLRTTDKTSWEVERTREIYSQISTKEKSFIKGKGWGEEGRDEILPSS